MLTSFDGALAGADINELAALKTPADCEAHLPPRPRRSSTASPAFKKPVVAAVDGPVLGGGAELSMACHARVVGPGLCWASPR